MPVEVEVDGVGIIEFPDEMSQGDIQSALSKQFSVGKQESSLPRGTSNYPDSLRSLKSLRPDMANYFVSEDAWKRLPQSEQDAYAKEAEKMIGTENRERDPDSHMTAARSWGDIGPTVKESDEAYDRQKFIGAHDYSKFTPKELPSIWKVAKTGQYYKAPDDTYRTRKEESKSWEDDPVDMKESVDSAINRIAYEMSEKGKYGTRTSEDYDAIAKKVATTLGGEYSNQLAQALKPTLDAFDIVKNADIHEKVPEKLRGEVLAATKYYGDQTLKNRSEKFNLFEKMLLSSVETGTKIGHAVDYLNPSKTEDQWRFEGLRSDIITDPRQLQDSSQGFVERNLESLALLAPKMAAASTLGPGGVGVVFGLPTAVDVEQSIRSRGAGKWESLLGGVTAAGLETIAFSGLPKNLMNQFTRQVSPVIGGTVKDATKRAIVKYGIEATKTGAIMTGAELQKRIIEEGVVALSGGKKRLDENGDEINLWKEFVSSIPDVAFQSAIMHTPGLLREMMAAQNVKTLSRSAVKSLGLGDRTTESDRDALLKWAKTESAKEQVEPQAELKAEPQAEPQIEQGLPRPTPSVESRESEAAAAAEGQPVGGQYPDLGPIAGKMNTRIEDIEARRDIRGDTKLPKLPAETMTQWEADAKQLLTDDPTVGFRIIDELVDRPRDLSPVEVQALKFHTQQIDSLVSKTSDALVKAVEGGDQETILQAQKRADDALALRGKTETGIQAAANLWGRSGRARQLEIANDWTKENQLAKRTIAKGGKPLTPEEHADIAEKTAEIARLQKELEKWQEGRVELDKHHEKVVKKTRERVNRKPEENILDYARENNIDYDTLLGYAEEVHAGRKDEIESRKAAKKEAHDLSGLNAIDVARIENSGNDYASLNVGGKTGQKLRRFDEFAQEVVSAYPEAFGRVEDASRAVWDLMREPAIKDLRLDDPRILREAAAMAAGSGDFVMPIEPADVPRKKADKAKVSERRAAAKKKVDEAWAEFGTLIRGAAYANPLDPKLVVGAAKVVKALVEQGYVTFTEFMAQAKKRMGEEAEKNRELFAAAWKQARGEGEIPGRNVDVTDLESVSRLARQFHREAVELGAEDREAAVKVVHEEMKQFVPNITREQTEDAISGYGDYQPLTKDAISVRVREDKAELQLIAKLRAILAKIPLKKSGRERQKLTDEARQLQQQINEAKKKYGVVVTDPETQLKSPLDAAKTAAKNRIADLNREIKTQQRIVNERTGVVPDTELEAMRAKIQELTAERDRLIPTEKQKLKRSKEYDDRLMEEWESEGGAGQPAKGKKQMSNAQYESILESRLIHYQDRLNRKDYEPKKLPRREPIQKQAEILQKIDELKKKLEMGRIQAERERWTVAQKALDVAGKGADLLRAMQFGGEFSAALVQQGLRAAAHPIAWAKMLPEAFKAFWSIKGEYEAELRLQQDPYYARALKANVEMASTHEGTSRQDEMFRGEWSHKIPLIAGSERFMTTIMNRGNLETFKIFARKLDAREKADLKREMDLAGFANDLSGRSTLKWGEGKWDFRGAGGLLSRVFLAFRYNLSRIKLAMFMPLMKGDATTRRIKAEEYARIAMGVGAAYGLAAMANNFLRDEDKIYIEFDRRSPKFLNMRLGNTWFDPTAGIAKIWHLSDLAIEGKRKKESGEIVSIRGSDKPYNEKGWWETMSDWERGKLAPIPGSIISVLNKEDPAGNKVTPASAALRSVYPVTYGEIYDIMRSHKVPAGLALSTLALLGAKINANLPQTEGKEDPAWYDPFPNEGGKLKRKSTRTN